MIDFESMGEELSKDSQENNLEGVASLVKMLVEKQDEINAMEETLKLAKEEFRKLAEEDLPQSMDAIGLLEFKYSDGRKVKVEDIVRASIPVPLKEEAFQWLEKNGHAELIKVKLELSFERGEKELALEVAKDILDLHKLVAETKESVHPQTLSAFCREQLELGVELPAKALGLYQGRAVKLSKK